MKRIKNFYLLLYLMIIPTSIISSTEITFLTHFIKPFTYAKNEDNTAYDGFAVEVVREMMNIMEYPQNFKMYPFNRALKMVQTEPNYALFIVARRPEREGTVKWVGPLATNGVYFYKKRGSEISINNLDAAKKVDRIGIGRGNADHTYLKNKDFNNLHPTDNQMQNLQMLLVDRISLTTIGEMVMPEMAREANIDPDLIERTDVKLYDSTVYIAFSNNIPDSEIEEWQQALDQLKASGKYQEIYNKYIQ